MNYKKYFSIFRALLVKKERGVEKTQIESSYDKFQNPPELTIINSKWRKHYAF